MSRSSFSLVGRLALATASIAITTSGLSTAGAFAAQAGETAGNLAVEQLLADRPSGSEATQEDSQLPAAVRDAVLKDVSARAQRQSSQFRIVRASHQTWPDGCLGIGGDGAACTNGAVAGWAVLVASGKQMWVYRTDESGSTVKWDEDASKTVAALRTTETTAGRRLNNRTTQTSERLTRRTTQETPTEGSRVETSERQTRMNSKEGFTLAILQPASSVSEVIARISLKAKNGKSYSKEKFVGDYKYKIKQKAKFVKGVNPGDRVVVRLYDVQNRLIGFSEFECLSANTAVNLILPDQPSEYRVVRTVFGVDADENGIIDPGASVYDYFTKISDSRGTESVTFLSSSKDVKVSQFQVEGLPAPPTTSVYTTSFKSGQFALANQSMRVLGDSVAAVLTSTPGKLASVTEVDDSSASSYDVSQMVAKYQQLRASSETRTQQTAVRSTTGNQQTSARSETATQQTAVRSTTGNQQTSARSETATQQTAVLSTTGNQQTSAPSETATQQTAVPSTTGNQQTSAPSTTATQQTAVRRTSGNQQTSAPSTTAAQQTAVRSTSGNQQTSAPSATGTQQTASRRANSTQQVAVGTTTRTSFKDISGNYWAKDFIAELADKKIILGYPDGTYRPDEPVTRAEFAAMISLAFQKNKSRQPINFKDVQPSEWTHSYALDAYQMGFLDVDSANKFNPDQNVTRLDILVALARGLNYSAAGSTNDLLSIYRDAGAIPSQLRAFVAAATEKGLVVSYPNVRLLNPKKQATRAEVAAILYQAMVSNGQASDITSPYVAGKAKQKQ